MNNSTSFNPFPGLRPFRTEEDYLFFGREEQTAELLALLRAHRFLAVVGTSGSGKSSLVRAGLIPALHRGTMTQAGSTWEVLLLRPGGNPLGNLAQAFCEADLYDAQDPETLPRLLATLRHSSIGLVDAYRQSDIEGANLLVVVDQFEELFRFQQCDAASHDMATVFVNLLLEASRQKKNPVYVVLTMRSDYLGDCSNLPGLAEAVNDGEYLIPRLRREQLRAAIEGPVAVGGGTIQQRLVQKLLNDAGDDPDQLPILQHALMRSWNRWQASSNAGEPLDLDDFAAAGGMSEALSRHADEVYQELSSARLQLVAEKLFKSLTERGPDNRGTRRPTRLEQLSAIVDATQQEVTTIVDAFRRPGVTFLMPMREVKLSPETVIDISHESLMRVWQRLDHWVEEESQSARIYKRLAETAALHREGKAGFYHDPDLQIASSWRDTLQPSEAWAALYHAGFPAAMQFLDESSAEKRRSEEAREAARQRELEQARKLAEAQRLRAEEQQRSARRLKGLVFAVSIAAALAFAGFVGAMFARQRAREAERLAVSQAQRAEQEQRRAERERLRALSAQREADRQRELTRRGLYVAQINRAQRISQTAGGGGSLHGLLDRLRPSNLEEEDLRGWEWYYLRSPRTRGIRRIQTRTGGVYCVAFSPDGAKIAFGGRSDVVQVQELASGKQIHTLSGHEGNVFTVAWSPDGRTIATSSLDATVRLWDAATGVPLHTLRGHTGLPRVRWSPDGSRLATAGGEGTLRIWDSDSGGQLRLLTRDDMGGLCAWSPDGRSLLTSSSSAQRLTIWDVDTGKAGTQFDGHQATITALAWAPRSGRIVSADAGGVGYLWDAESGRGSASRLVGHATTIFDVEWSPDGQSIATASFDNTARIWDASDAELLHTLGDHSSEVYDVDWHPGSRQVATASTDGSVILWDLAKQGASESTFATHGRSVLSVVWSPNSRWLASSSSDGTVIIWDADQQRPLRRFDSRGEVSCLAWSPDGHRLAGGVGRTVRVWDATAGGEIAVVRGHAGEVTTVAWSPDQQWLAAGVAAGRVYLWDARDFDQGERTVLRGGWAVRAVAWSPDSHQLAAAGRDWGGLGIRVRIWDPTTLRLVSVLRGRNEEINALAWSPDGQRLASAGHYSDALSQVANVRIWEMSTGTSAQVIGGHLDRVAAVDWMPDGSRLVTASHDGNVIVWSAESGQELLTFDSPGGAVNCAGWSPDGTRIAAGDSAGGIRLFDGTRGYETELSDRLLPPLGHRISQETVTARDHQLRAEIHARHGRWNDAAADFDAAAKLQGDADASWFSTQWWLAGPFPGELREPYQPELQPDPFQPLPAPSNSEAPAAVSRWRPVALDALSGLSLVSYFEPSDNISCYVYSRFYSPRPQEIGVLLGSDDYSRLWINRQLVHENTIPGRARPDQEICFATLQQGWNDVLLKVVNGRGDFRAYFRFSRNPAELAEAFERAGKWAPAVERWQQAVEAIPERVELRLRLIAAYRQAGQLDQASAALSGLIESHPKSSSMLTDLAKLYELMGRTAEMLAVYDRLIELQPDDWNVRRERGRVLSQTGEPASLDHPAELIGRALAFQEQGKDVLAEADFDKAFAKIGDKQEDISRLSEVFSQVADIYVGKGELAPAIAILDNAVQSRADDAGIYERRGNLHARSRHWKEAAKDLAKAIELDPESHWNWYRLSPLLVETGDLDGYREHCRELVVRFEDAGPVEAGRVIQGCILLPDAVDNWDEVLARSTEIMKPGAMATRDSSHGTYAFRRGNYRDAIDWIEPALESHPQAVTRARALFPLAMAYFHLGQTAQALVTLEQGEQLLRGGRSAADLGVSWHDWLMARILRHEAAELIRGPAHRLVAEADDLAADAGVRGDQDMSAEVVKRFSAAIDLAPSDPGPLEALAGFYALQRRWQEAAGHYVRVAELSVGAAAPAETESVDTVSMNWEQGSAVVAQSGDDDRYHAYCGWMIQRFRDTTLPQEAERTAKASLFRPPSGPNLAGASRLADQSVSLLSPQTEWVRPYAQFVKGLAEYRNGRYESAIDWCNRSLAAGGAWFKVAQAHLVSALAHARLNRTTEARASLAEARLILDKRNVTVGLTADWSNWVVCQSLLGEAESLIDGR